MKKSIYVVLGTFSLLTILSHVCGCGPSGSEPNGNTTIMTHTIVEIEALPTGACIYTVDEKNKEGYTFIDSCGKYRKGEQF